MTPLTQRTLRCLLLLGAVAGALAACSRNPTIANAKAWPTNPPYPEGTVLTATCNAGYGYPVEQPATATCGDGVWSISGSCVRVCSGGPTLESPGVIWPQSCTDRTPMGTYCSTECVISEQGLWGTVSQLCSASGWSTVLGRCQPNGACSTAPPVVVTNGAFPTSCMGTAVGSSCTVACNPGYGGPPTTLACNADETSPTKGTWATSVDGPGCKRVVMAAADEGQNVGFLTGLGFNMAPVPETTIADYSPVPSLAVTPAACFTSPPAPFLSFSPVPVARTLGDSWASWAPGVPSGTRLYAALDFGDAPTTITLPQGTTAFGLRVEPNYFSVYTMTADAVDSNGNLFAPMKLTQSVNGNAGAKFFGAYLNSTLVGGGWIHKFSIGAAPGTGTGGYAFGELVIACNRPFATPPSSPPS